MALTYEDVAKLLSEHYKVVYQQITKAFEDFQFRSLTSEFDGIPMPEFSGDPNEDVKEFLRQFHRVATFNNYSNEQKAEILPLLLTGNARAWINSISELATRTFEDLSEALVKRFHTETDIFLLRLQLSDRKQLPGESVLQFASEIRKFCLRLEVSIEDNIFHFVNGLRSELRNYVFLQRPKTFSEAETLARLKEAFPEKQPGDRTDRTDKILSVTTQFQKRSADKHHQVTAYNDYEDFVIRNNEDIGTDEITELVAQPIENGRNYTCRKITQPTIAHCDDGIQSSILIENTEIIEPVRVKVYPAMESPTLGEQNKEKATTGVVSESEEQTIETGEIMEAEVLTLNFEEAELEEQIVVFEQNPIIYVEREVSCRQILTETAATVNHELVPAGNHLTYSFRHIRAKYPFSSDVKEFELSCSQPFKFIHFLIILMFEMKTHSFKFTTPASDDQHPSSAPNTNKPLVGVKFCKVFPPPYTFNIPRKRKPPDKFFSPHVSVWVKRAC